MVEEMNDGFLEDLTFSRLSSIPPPQATSTVVRKDTREELFLKQQHLSSVLQHLFQSDSNLTDIGITAHDTKICHDVEGKSNSSSSENRNDNSSLGLLSIDSITDLSGSVIPLDANNHSTKLADISSTKHMNEKSKISDTTNNKMIISNKQIGAGDNYDDESDSSMAIELTADELKQLNEDFSDTDIGETDKEIEDNDKNKIEDIKKKLIPIYSTINLGKFGNDKSKLDLLRKSINYRISKIDGSRPGSVTEIRENAQKTSIDSNASEANTECSTPASVINSKYFRPSNTDSIEKFERLSNANSKCGISDIADLDRLSTEVNFLEDEILSRSTTYGAYGFDHNTFRIDKKLITNLEQETSPASDISDIGQLNLNNITNILHSTDIDNKIKHKSFQEIDEIDIVSRISAKLGLSGVAKNKKSNPIRKAEKENEVSIVYPTEDGNFVTDLAFKSDLKKQMSGEIFSESNFCKIALSDSEEFFSSDEAAKILAKDEKDFERDHMFEGENVRNPSLLSMNSSWNPTGKQDITRPSWFSDKMNEDKSYMRISIGQFMQARTEVLGSLAGDSKERPTFGINFTVRDSKSSLKESLSKDVQIELPRISASSSSDVSDNDTDRENTDTNSLLSIQSISKLISEASVSDEPKVLAQRVLANVNAKKSKKKIHKRERSVTKSHLSRSKNLILSSQDSGIHSDLIKTNSNQELSSSSSSSLVHSKISLKSNLLNLQSKDKFSNSKLQTLWNYRENNKSQMRYNHPDLKIKKSLSTQSLVDPMQDRLIYLSKERTVSDTDLFRQTTKYTDDNSQTDLNRTLKASSHDNLVEDLDQTLTSVQDIEKVESHKSSVGKVEAATSPLHISSLSQDTQNNIVDDSNTKTSLFCKNHTNQSVQSQALYTTANINTESCSYHSSNILNHQFSKCSSANSCLMQSIPMAIPYGTPITSIQPTSYIPVTMNTNCFASHGITNYCHGSFLDSHNAINFLNTNQLQYNSVCPASTVSGVTNINSKRVVELKLPEPICIGDTKQFTLILQNPTLSCLMCSLQVNVTVDNQVLPAASVSGFDFPHHLRIESGATKKVQINYVPRQKGNVLAVLEVNTDSPTPVFGYPLTAVMMAEVEWPKISIVMDQGANFGIVAECKSIMHSVKLINHSNTVVPIRLQISEDFQCTHSFSFGVQEINPNESKNCNTVWHFLSSKILFCRLAPQKPESSDAIEFPIIFQSERLKEGNWEQVSAILNATLESSVIYEALGSVRLSATVGIVKFLIKEAAQGVMMESRPKHEIRKSVTLENQGSVFAIVNLDFKMSNGEFKVLPNSLELNPGEKVNLQLIFCPNDIGIQENVLQAKFENKIYELLNIRGICKKNQRKQTVRKNVNNPDSHNINSPIILDANIRYLTWGGVDIGDMQCKNLVLRNASPNIVAHLKLFIKGNGTFRLDENLSSNSEITLLPLETMTVKVIFAPKDVAVYKGVLYIKPMIQEQTKFHYSFPLNGFGGICKLTLQGIDRRDDGSYYLEIQNQIAPDYSTVTLTDFTLINNGKRAAFIKILCYTDDKMQQLVPTSIMTTQPSEFVLQPQESLMVVVVFNHEVAKQAKITSGILGIIYGEEILRQRFKSVSPEGNKPLSIPFPLENTLIFTSKYAGEVKVPYESLYQEAPSDLNVFYDNLFRYFINFAVRTAANIESVFASSYMTELHESYGSLSETSPMESTVLNNNKEKFSNLFSPPVKGCSDTHLSSVSSIAATDFIPLKNSSCSSSNLSNIERNAAGEKEVKSKEKEAWIVEPTTIELNQGMRTEKIQIKNISNRNLRFKLISSLDILYLAPEQGVLLAKDNLDICIRLSKLYLEENKIQEIEGFITVVCDSIQKNVSVKICPISRASDVNSCYSSQGDYSHINTLLDVSDVNGTLFELSVHCPEEVKFKNTKIGYSSQTTFQIKNVKNRKFHWILFPFSNHSKKHDQEMNPVFPQVIKLNKQYGVLKPEEALDIVATFTPKEVRSYSQTWQFIVTSDKRTYIRFTGEGIASEERERPSHTESCSVSRNLTLESTKLDQNFCPISSSTVKKATQNGEDTSTKSKNITDVSQKDLASAEETHSTNSSRNSAVQNPSQSLRMPVISNVKRIDFPTTRCGEDATVKLKMKNLGLVSYKISLSAPNPPFFIKHNSLVIKGKYYLNIPISFCPDTIGIYNDVLLIRTELNYDIKVVLKGEAVL